VPTTLPPILYNSLTLAGQFKYLLVFLGVIIEGPFVMIASGFLLHLKVFSITPLFLSLVLGDLIADVGWYYVGYFILEPFLRKHGHFLSVTPELFEKAKNLFARYHIKILLISKITLGVGIALATLLAAGATKVSFRTYLILNAIGEIVLVAVLLVIGYFFGEVYDSIAKDFKIVFIVAAAVISILVIFGFSKYIKSKIK